MVYHSKVALLAWGCRQGSCTRPERMAMLEGAAALPTPSTSTLLLSCAVQYPLAPSGHQWILLSGVHPTQVCAIMDSGQGPKELCRQQPSASSVSEIQEFGAFPEASCEMVPGGCAGGVCPLQSRASPGFACRVSPLDTLGHRGGDSAWAGDHKALPC